MVSTRVAPVPARLRPRAAPVPPRATPTPARLRPHWPPGKGVYQFANKYGANVDEYSPIYNPEEWSPSGDFYAGGKTGLLLWVVTLTAILLGGALLVYNTSALAS